MLLELNKKQQAAFNKLKRAYKECKKQNVLLVNKYGEIVAYNGELIEDFGDNLIKPRGIPVYYLDVNRRFIHNQNTISGVDVGRADDESIWMLGLTEEGFRIYNDENLDD